MNVKKSVLEKTETRRYVSHDLHLIMLIIRQVVITFSI